MLILVSRDNNKIRTWEGSLYYVIDKNIKVMT